MSIADTINKLLRRKPDHHYVSPIDRFLENYNQEHPEKSASQIKEIAKYQRINHKRDNKDSVDQTDQLI